MTNPKGIPDSAFIRLPLDPAKMRLAQMKPDWELTFGQAADLFAEYGGVAKGVKTILRAANATEPKRRLRVVRYNKRLVRIRVGDLLDWQKRCVS